MLYEWKYQKQSRTFEIIDAAPAKILQALDLVGAVVAQNMRERAPRESGELQNAISHTKPVQLSETEFLTRVGVFDPEIVGRAIAHEFGSGLYSPKRRDTYLITPKRARLLYFQWKDAPPEIVAKRGPDPWIALPYVKHPGVPGRLFMARGVHASMDAIKAIFERMGII